MEQIISEKLLDLDSEVKKLVNLLTPIVSDFLTNKSGILDMFIEPAYRERYRERFETYKSIPDDFKEDYVKTIVFLWSRASSSISDTFSVVKDKWYKQYYRQVERHKAFITELPKGLKRSIILDILDCVIASEFAEFERMPKNEGASLLKGTNVGVIEEVEVYVSKDWQKYLAISINKSYGFYRMGGGWGITQPQSCFSFIHPCFGIDCWDYAGFSTPENLTIRAKSFCKVLKEVYPYHKRLWDGLKHNLE